MRALSPIALVALIVFVAGCGGLHPRRYVLRRTRDCLGRGERPTWRLPGVPRTFQDLRVAPLGDVLFAPTTAAARTFFATERRGDAEAVRQRNAIVVWAAAATPHWRRHVLGCLR